MSHHPTPDSPTFDEKKPDYETEVQVLDSSALDEVTRDVIEASEGQYSEEDYKKLLKRVDMILIPMMWSECSGPSDEGRQKIRLANTRWSFVSRTVLYGTQQADKTSIATQATFGFQADTGMIGQQ